MLFLQTYEEGSMRFGRLSRFSIPLCAMLLLWLFPLCAQAAPGDVLTGEYVLILNADLSNGTEVSPDVWQDLPQKSGTIYFDDTASAANGFAAASSFAAAAANVAPAPKPLDSSGYLYSALQTASAAPAYTPGQSKTIGRYGKNFTLAAVGTHCLIWMDDAIQSGYTAAGKDVYAMGGAAAAVYDEKSYPVIRQFDAGGVLDYADGSGKLSILLESGISSGYFDFEDSFSHRGNVTAIHINAARLPTDFETFGPLFAHECQHAVSAYLELVPNRYQFIDLWLNEGLSVAAMDTYTKGHDGNGWLNGLIGASDHLRNGKSFLYQDYTDDTAANYSMPFLFLRYLNTQANGGYDARGDFYSGFYEQPAYSSAWRRYDANRVEQVLGQYARTADWDFKDALSNFYIAIQVQALQGPYGFYGDPVVARKISGFPLYGGASGGSVDIEKCGAIMVKTLDGRFTVPADAGADIVFIAFSPSAYARGLDVSTAGTADDPHRIHDAQTLSYIWDARYCNDHFLLTADVEADAGYYDFWNNNFYNYNMPQDQRHWPDFYGVLDGGGHAVTGLTRPLCKNNYGLIRNLDVTCALTLEEQLLGAFACMNYGTIENCAVHGAIVLPDTVASNNFYAWVGGVAGDMRSGNAQAAYPAKISRCMSDVTIRGKLAMYNYFYIGGVVGAYAADSGASLSNCYSAATLDVRIKERLPGVVVLGGLAGDSSAALTKNCYSVANVSFTNENGGDMRDTLYLGRMFGRASNYNASYESLYALDGLAACGGRYTPEGITVQSAARMQASAAYPGFDFAAVWEMPASGGAYAYPRLRSVLAIMGDVTQDGLVGLADAVRICRHIAALQPLPAPLAALADVNGDGTVAVDDLLCVCRYIAGTRAQLAA